MNPRRALFHGIWIGMFMSIAGITIRQDLLGKEKYILEIQNHWTNSKVSLPIEVALFVAAVIWAGVLQWRTRPRSPTAPTLFHVDPDAPPQVVDGMAMHKVETGSWAYGVEGVKKTKASGPAVYLKFVNPALRRGLKLEMGTRFAREVAHEILRESDRAEVRPEDEPERKTAWDHIDGMP